MKDGAFQILNMLDYQRVVVGELQRFMGPPLSTAYQSSCLAMPHLPFEASSAGLLTNKGNRYPLVIQHSY